MSNPQTLDDMASLPSDQLHSDLNVAQPHSDTSHSAHEPSKTVLMLSLILTVFVGLTLFFGYKYLTTNNFNPPTQTQPAQTLQLETPTTIPITTAPNMPVVENKPTNVYLLTLELKSPNIAPDISLGEDHSFMGVIDYLNSLFQIEKQPDQPAFKLFSDVRTASPYGNWESPTYPLFPLFDLPVYLVTDPPVVLDPVYEDSYSIIRATAQDQSIYPYFVKHDYCQKDADCIIGSDMCTVGAYNYYNQYIDGPWGCGPPNYKNSYYPYGTYSQELGCQTEMKFAGARCQNNVCIELEPKQVCAENPINLP